MKVGAAVGDMALITLDPPPSSKEFRVSSLQQGGKTHNPPPFLEVPTPNKFQTVPCFIFMCRNPKRLGTIKFLKSTTVGSRILFHNHYFLTNLTELK